MSKRILKAKDVERLENTSVVAFLPIGDVDGGGLLPGCACTDTCNQGCTGTQATTCQVTGCGETCQTGCTGTRCVVCVGTCELPDVLGFKIVRG